MSVIKSPFEEPEESDQLIQTPTRKPKNRQTIMPPVKDLVDDEAVESDDAGTDENALQDELEQTDDGGEEQQLPDISADIREYLIIESTIKRATSALTNTRKRKRELSTKLLSWMNSRHQIELPVGNVSIKKDVITGSKPHNQESIKKTLINNGVEEEDANLLAEAIIGSKEAKPPRDKLVVVGQ